MDPPINLIVRGDGVAEDGMRCVGSALDGLLEDEWDVVAEIGSEESRALSVRGPVSNGFNLGRLPGWRRGFPIEAVKFFDGVTDVVASLGSNFRRCGDGEVGEGGRPFVIMGLREEILNTGLNTALVGNSGLLLESFSRCMASMDLSTLKFAVSLSVVIFVDVVEPNEGSAVAAFASSISHSKFTIGIFHSLALTHFMPS